MSEIRVLIVEDDPLIAIDIEQCLSNMNFIISGTAYDVDDAFLQLQNNTPDAVILDISLGDANKDGIDVAAVVHEQYQLPFIYLTSHADRGTLERAKKTFPAGYIIKPFNEKDLLVGLEIALHNHAARNIATQPKLSFSIINKNLKHTLSEREFDVLQQFYEGKTNQQMADHLFVSVNTIKTHIANIYAKLDVASRTEAIAKIRLFY